MSDPTEADEAAEPSSRELVTFRVRTQTYAVPIESVVEMTLLRDLEPITGAPTWILGMMQLRNGVVPIVDLRLRMGLDSLRQEIANLESDLQQRKADHINWLQTLETCCESGERFELQRDPTQCAFGLWFYSFKTEDAILANQIAKFETPHNRIHALADQCLGLTARGQQQQAQKEIDATRETDLSEIIRLFDTTIRAIRERNRQIVVILRGETENLGLTVDRVESVLTIDARQISRRPLHELEADEANQELLVDSVVRTGDEVENGLIQILDVDRVFASAGVRGVKSRLPPTSEQFAATVEPGPREIALE